MKFFKPEDFETLLYTPMPEHIADIANSKLEREGKVVYGQKLTDDFLWDEKGEPSDTHRALPINIEELSKKECEHEGIQVDIFNYGKGFRCSECGVKLKVKWQACDD